MIIINKSGYLKYKNLRFKCALGKAGIGKKKIEGDNITPKGTFKIVDIYYREDRIKKLSSKFKLIKIKKKMGWCNDPKSEKYNNLELYNDESQVEYSPAILFYNIENMKKGNRNIILGKKIPFKLHPAFAKYYNSYITTEEQYLDFFRLIARSV